MVKRKGTNGKTMIDKTLYRTTQIPLKTGDKLVCAEQVSSSWSIDGTHRVNSACYASWALILSVDIQSFEIVTLLAKYF
jgi:hypothetical protein